jgi:PhnB protein
MSKATQWIPTGFHTLTPHLIIKDAAKAIDFYKKVFGAEELNRMPTPDGRLMHACLKIGDSILFLCDEFPEHDCGVGASPQTLNNAHATIHMFVENVDKAYQRAVDAGAKAIMPPQDMFWGDRYGRLIDPFGQPWSLATHKEDLTPEEMKKRMESACAPAKAGAKV